ncbi:hypothetical protein [Microvirga splendida]|uniref:Uncharacterized protein n=1 Tax=Microvirga splendida TaxID=2795727 RepID=A0ABS0Y4N4_9HYPH|nr:hypothetical protein [Microvirga splendida]MBJ6127269.1 hypothetical protein [Microvirga splendida]
MRRTSGFLLATGAFLPVLDPGHLRAQQEREAPIAMMIDVRGYCRAFEAGGVDRSCVHGALYLGYRNGRAAIMVNGEAAGAPWAQVSFSGRADRQAGLGRYPIVLDRVLIGTEASSQTVPATGRCDLTMAPGRVVETLSCEAKAATGHLYRLEVDPVRNPVAIRRF